MQDFFYLGCRTLKTMEKNTDSNSKKPQWLRLLEQQSWQAELVISGIAIFGSLQLPEVIFSIADEVLVRFSDDSLTYLQYFFIYLLIGVRFLIAGFIIHFVLRALWVGMLGLVSVFPQGIREKSSMHSADYLKKIRAEFSDINKFNQKLDKFSSLILSISAAAVQIFLLIAFWVLVVILLHNLFLMVFPVHVASAIIKGMVLILIIFSFLISLLNFGKIKESTIAKKLQYPITRGFNRVFTHIFYGPYLYIFMTLSTNLTIKTRHKILGIFLLFTLTALFSFDLSSSSVQYFSPQSYFTMNQSPDISMGSNYENSISEKRILRPVIQSQTITTDHIKLFIPWFEREVDARGKICGTPAPPDSLSQTEKRQFKNRFINNCMSEYYKISIDDKIKPGLKFKKHYHQHHEEKGFQTFIALDSLENGQHLLKIEKGYTNEDGKSAVQYVPFYLERNR
ncbi:MAG: hypothetical protein DWQ02_23230 [Bacteroidetes bacterium]|nr:MAG: hypothetical protein DWQ02_23230 [Bacteroidota bacterium]